MSLVKENRLENQLLNIKSNLREYREWLENLRVNGNEQETFRQELISISELISSELTSIQNTKKEIKNSEDIANFLVIIAKKYDNIRRLSLRISLLSMSFKEYEIVELITNNYCTNSIVLAFILCYETVNGFYKINKNSRDESLADLLYQCSETLEPNKEELDKSSGKYLYKNLAFFASVILYINHKVSTLEEIVDNKNKGFGQNNQNYHSIKQKINDTKVKLINTLFSIIKAVRNKDKDINITITSVDYQVYEHFTKTLGETPWCKLSYLDGVLRLISPGIPHEKATRGFEMIISIYCTKKGIQCYTFGSADIYKSKKSIPGKQPDASFCFRRNKTIPDLAIECNFSNGSIDDLNIFIKMGIPEVWMYDENDGTRIFYLSNKQYEEIERSKLLPDFTIDILNKIVKISLKEPVNKLVEYMLNFS